MVLRQTWFFLKAKQGAEFQMCDTLNEAQQGSVNTERGRLRAGAPTPNAEGAKLPKGTLLRRGSH